MSDKRPRDIRKFMAETGLCYTRAARELARRWQVARRGQTRRPEMLPSVLQAQMDQLNRSVGAGVAAQLAQLNRPLMTGLQAQMDQLNRSVGAGVAAQLAQLNLAKGGGSASEGNA